MDHINRMGISRGYFPNQPEIRNTTELYQEIKPINDPLAHSIALFYQFTTTQSSIESLSLIPDGCFDILFCCSEKTPSAILWTSPIQRRKQPNLIHGCDYFGVRFFPEQNLLKLNAPMKELLDQQIPLSDVLNIHSSMIEEVGMGRSLHEKIKIFKMFMEKMMSESNLDHKIIDYAVDRIYSTGGIVNMRHLAADIGYTEQYIRRKFEEYIGFSPKQFCQIVKFQNSLVHILKTPLEGNPKNSHYENSYYDQAHFIKGFKKFTNVTPNQYKQYLA